VYEPPLNEERPGCRDTIVLTRAVFATILPALAAMLGLLAFIMAGVFLMSIHPLLALIAVAGAIIGIVVFIRWERGRYRPPEL
jgi:hypothetical protein